MTVALITFAAGVGVLLLTAGLRAGFHAAWRRRARARAAADREPVHPAPATTTARTMPVPLVPDARDGATQPPPSSGPASGPVKHIGATEDFGRELRALRNAEVSPELVSDIETELRWGQIWHDFERDLVAQLDELVEPVLDQLLDDQPLQRMRVYSAVKDTGQLDLRALRDLLTAEDAGLVAA